MQKGLSAYMERSKTLRYNQDVFCKWCAHLIKERGGSEHGTPTIYGNDIILFLEQIDIPIQAITADEVNRFFHNKAAATQNRQSAAIKKFLTFASEYLSKPIDINNIFKYVIFKNSDERNNEDAPLSLNEIVILRNSLYKAKKMNKLFTFEMAYRYGVSIEEMTDCCRENYSNEKACFNLNGKSIMIDDFLSKLIAEYPETLVKVVKGTYQGRVSRMEKYIGRPIKFSDITATRKIHLIKCPCCGKEFLNNSVNWILAEHEKDSFKQKWIICKCCASTGESNG